MELKFFGVVSHPLSFYVLSRSDFLGNFENIYVFL